MAENEPIFIALGSNLGDSVAIIRAAMDRLQEFSTTPLLSSSLVRTDPIDCPPGSPPFINAAVRLTAPPDLTPLLLLRKLQAIEVEFGREPKKKVNEPRPLDLDLIAFGSRVMSIPELVLPHPRAHLRQFVLQPLAEIAPALVLPNQTCNVFELLIGMGLPRYKLHQP